MHINVEVWSQNTYYDELTKVCDSTFVYVAIDEAGRIRLVPEE
jgi:acyl-CoA hydrolase